MFRCSCGAVVRLRTSTTVVPIFWGTQWGNSEVLVGDKITGLDYLYSHVGGSSYLHTNFEYTDGSGHVNTTQRLEGRRLHRYVGDSVRRSVDYRGPERGRARRPAAIRRPAPTTRSPTWISPAGTLGHCAWHSSGTINGTQGGVRLLLQPDGYWAATWQSPGSTGHSQGLAALGQRDRPRAQRDAHRSSAQCVVRPAGRRERRQVRVDVQRSRDDRQKPVPRRSRGTGATRRRTPAPATRTSGCIQTS